MELSPDALRALERVAASYEGVAAGLRDFVGAVRRGTTSEVIPPVVVLPNTQTPGSLVASVNVFNLWRRLGADNRAFLLAVATSYAPDATFTLAQMADAANTKTSSARARLMNIGRSMKSLGVDASILWSVRWDGTENNYSWDAVAHEALLQLGER